MDESDMDEGVTNLDERRVQGVDPGSKTDVPRRVPASRVKDPGSKIRRLKCVQDVDAMLRDGKYLREIVTHIQDVSGEMTDMSRRAVTYLVKEHKESLFSGDGDTDAPKLSNGLDEEDPFYELHSMQQHYKILEQRIAMEVDTEKNLTKLFSTTHKEFQTLQRMGESILKKKDQMGLLSREGTGMRQRVGSGTPGRVDVAEIVANPESRHKVMGFVEALIRNPDLLDSLSGDDRVPKTSEAAPRKRKKRKKNK